jgi:hypothetical protein
MESRLRGDRQVYRDAPEAAHYADENNANIPLGYDDD